jgi:hypothetical protein
MIQGSLNAKSVLNRINMLTLTPSRIITRYNINVRNDTIRNCKGNMIFREREREREFNKFK